jgi:predicted transcriptional regulator
LSSLANVVRRIYGMLTRVFAFAAVLSNNGGVNQSAFISYLYVFAVEKGAPKPP